MTFVTPTATVDEDKCGLDWNVFAQYMFLGGEDEASDVVETFASLGMSKILSRKIENWNDDYVKQADPEYLMPIAWMTPSDISVGGVPSVLVAREKTSDLAEMITDRLTTCANQGLTTKGLCGRVEIYHDITGNAKENFSGDEVSITSSMRNALFHVVTGGGSHATMDVWYERLGDNSYQNECAYEISQASGGWKKRIFGEKHGELLAIKNKYDPEGLFWCQHCVGDEE